MLNTAKTIPVSCIVGQERALRLINSLLGLNRYPPLLFTGPSGVGKRTAALLYAQAANCEAEGTTPCGTCRTCLAVARLQHPDVRLFFPARRAKEQVDPEEMAIATVRESELYAMSATRPALDPTLVIPIETVRWIRGQTARPPVSARLRVFIILQAHRLTLEAANALLKTIEELPRTTTIVLTTDVPADIQHTIRSRCQTVRFGALPPELVASELQRRGLTPSTVEGELNPTAAAAQWNGSLGDAIRLLQDSTPEPDNEQTNTAAVAAELLKCSGTAGRALVDAVGEPADLAKAALVLCALALRELTNPEGKRQTPTAWRLNGWTRSELCSTMWFLLNTARESGSNLHPQLTLHELMTGISARGCRP